LLQNQYMMVLGERAPVEVILIIDFMDGLKTRKGALVWDLHEIIPRDRNG